MAVKHYENIASTDKMLCGAVGGRAFSLNARMRHVQAREFPANLCPECKAAQLAIVQRHERNSARRARRRP